jgi:hypothetical protein
LGRVENWRSSNALSPVPPRQTVLSQQDREKFLLYHYFWFTQKKGKGEKGTVLFIPSFTQFAFIYLVHLVHLVDLVGLAYLVYLIVSFLINSLAVMIAIPEYLFRLNR